MRESASSSLISETDVYLFNEGSHFRLWEKLGAHLCAGGTQFGGWAPNAESVSVIGDHNGWDPRVNPLPWRGSSGIWEGFVPGVGRGAVYKFHIVSRGGGCRVDRADPLAFTAEVAPKTGSVVWDLEYEWGDLDWMQSRDRRHATNAPMSIYEMHLGSWMRLVEE